MHHCNGRSAFGTTLSTQPLMAGGLSLTRVRGGVGVPAGSIGGGLTHSTAARQLPAKSATKSAPPKPKPKPKLVRAPRCEMVVAVFEYSAQNDQELSFDEGDEIELLQRTNADWWRGRIAVAQGAAKSCRPEDC